MDLKKICRGCFREKPEAGGVCPYCGFDEIKYERERDPEVLPLNTVLQGKYVIGRCLGRGGFGITYMGWHVNLDTVVAIKEFFPSGIVSRDTGNQDRTVRSDVTMVNTGSTKAYRKSLDGFIKEAKTLGGLRLPGVVLVHDFFEENRTAYIIMDYVAGENLSLWLKHSGGKLPEEKVLKLISPLIGSLQKLHEKGIIHRDISPDNLILQPDGSIMLVDFGAARTVVLEQEAESAVQSMTVVLKPGYAPIEQYSSHGRQGPWTDVYAFCATLFRMLTGAAPADPGTRADTDNDEEILRKSLEKAGVSQKTINALIKGLQLLSKNRYQSMRELDEALYGAEESGTESHADGSGTQQPQTGQRTQEKKTVTTGNTGPSQPSGKKTHRRSITALLLGALILAAAVIGFTVHSRNSKRQEATERVSEAETQELSEKITETELQEVPEKIAETEQREEPESEAKTELREETERKLETERITEAEAKTETETNYLLTVKSGKISGTEDNSGSFHEGERITVEPEERDHYTFTGWTVSDDEVIRQSDGENLIFAMPAEDFTVTAEYEEVTYTLTVKNGIGTGNYHAGDTVTIRAEERDGYDFTFWKVNRGDISIADISSPKTTVVTGVGDTEIEAVYTEAGHTVAVQNGSIVGGQSRGKYKPGTSITIKADIPDGYLFGSWNIEAGEITLSDPSAEQTTFVMGDRDVIVSAVKETYPVLIRGVDFTEQLKKLSGSYYKGAFYDVDEIVESIICTDDPAPDGANTVNVSQTGAPVMAWFDKGSKTIYISTQADKIYLNKNSGEMFYNFAELRDLDINIFDTSSVMFMSSMFEGCSSLSSLDVSNFDTSSVTEMGSMFKGCSSLVNLDVSNFDTSSVTSIGPMFDGCSSLSSLDLGSFDTSSVTNMYEMFHDCSSLVSLDLSNFDTSSVTSMQEMFYDCSSLSSLDISGFDTSSVTSMWGMFHGCSSLTEVITDNQELLEAYESR